MPQVGSEGLRADAVLDHVRRQNHAVAALRGQLAHDEIFRQVILHRVEAADARQRSRRAAMVGPSANFMPSSMRATSTPPMNSVFSPTASSVDQKLRPGTARYGTGGQAELRILELGGDHVASMSGVTRMSLSDITSRSCRAAASMRSRL